jgi:NADH:ubiquinone oxidoreductase subunit 3 (subunit A)
VLLILLFLVSKKISQKKWRRSCFECGFSSGPSNNIPFSTQFFIVAILFLIFDIEISILTPFPLEKTIEKNKITILLFLSILGGGLLYE